MIRGMELEYVNLPVELYTKVSGEMISQTDKAFSIAERMRLLSADLKMEWFQTGGSRLCSLMANTMREHIVIIEDTVWENASIQMVTTMRDLGLQIKELVKEGLCASPTILSTKVNLLVIKLTELVALKTSNLTSSRLNLARRKMVQIAAAFRMEDCRTDVA